MPEGSPSVAVVGATGAVGREVLAILSERGWPSDRIVLYASARSLGSVIGYRGEELAVRSIETIADRAPDFALLCADAVTARAVTAALARAPSVCVDNSSAFRMEPGVPLVIPEVNAGLLEGRPRLIANPNCSTIMLLTALHPLRETLGVRHITVTTYQAVSGAGAAGIEELYEQTRAALGDGNRDGAEPRVFPVPCAFDVFEHESAVDPDTGFNGEESKMIAETRKIWDAPALGVLPTCVRVPVERAHAQAVIVELGRESSVEEVRGLLAGAPGVRLHDDERGPLTPRASAGGDDVLIGRVRIDPARTDRALIWLCCDQIRKGAALNAVQIMERVIELRRSRSASGSLVAQCAGDEGNLDARKLGPKR